MLLVHDGQYWSPSCQNSGLLGTCMYTNEIVCQCSAGLPLGMLRYLLGASQILNHLQILPTTWGIVQDMSAAE